MENRKARSPIDLEEVKGKKEEPSTGRIDYTGVNGGPPKSPSGYPQYQGGRPAPPKRDWMPGIVAIVVAAVISAGMVFTIPASGGEVNSLKTQVSGLIGTASDLINVTQTDSKRIDNITAQMNSYVQEGDLSEYALVTDIESPQGLLENVRTELDALTTSLQSTLDGYEERIAVLEEEEEESSSNPAASEEVSDEIWMDFKGPSTFVFDKDGPALQTWNLLMEVVNDSSLDIYNTEVELILYPDWLSSMNISSVTIASATPDFAWQAYIQGSAIIIVGTEPTWGDGLEVAANDDENVFLTLNVTTTDPLPLSQDIRYNIEAEVTDFKMVP